MDEIIQKAIEQMQIAANLAELQGSARWNTDWTSMGIASGLLQAIDILKRIVVENPVSEGTRSGMKIRRLTIEELIDLSSKVNTYEHSFGPNVRRVIAEVLRLRRKLAVQKASSQIIAVARGPEARVMKIVPNWDVPEPKSCPAPSSANSLHHEPDSGRSLHPEGGPRSD